MPDGARLCAGLPVWGSAEGVPDVLCPLLGIEPAAAASITMLTSSLTMAVRYGEAAGDAAVLNRAVNLARRLLAEVPEEDPARAGILYDLTFSLEVLILDFSEIRYLDETIARAEAIITQMQPADGRYLIQLQMLGSLLMTRFAHNRQAEDLDKAIGTHRATLATDQASDQTLRAGLLSNLAAALLMRCEHHEPSLADLGEAIGACRRQDAIRCGLPEGSPEQSLQHFPTWVPDSSSSTG